MNLNVNVLKGVKIRPVDPIIVADYAEDMNNAAEFPPLIVFTDGTDHWLADGFHRLEAAKVAGFQEITADIREGGERDALLYACGANSSHGFRRTNADKRHAVETMLRDEEWRQWTDVAIAKSCGVSSAYVGRVRTELNGVIPVPDQRKAGGGRTIKVGERGRKKAAERVPRPVEEVAEPQPIEETAKEPEAVEETRPCGWFFSLAAIEEEDEPEVAAGSAAPEEDQSVEPQPPAWLKSCTLTIDKVKQGVGTRYFVALQSPAGKKEEAEGHLDELRRWLRRQG